MIFHFHFDHVEMKHYMCASWVYYCARCSKSVCFSPRCASMHTVPYWLKKCVGNFFSVAIEVFRGGPLAFFM